MTLQPMRTFKNSFLKNSFKRAASEVRIYDAALPDRAIKKLAKFMEIIEPKN